MKISQEAALFQPVTIVLETQEEIDQLTDFLRKNKTKNIAGAFIDTLCGKMLDYRKNTGYFSDCTFVEPQ